MAQKKYVSLNALSILVDNIKSLFATKSEMNEKSEVQMVTVGSEENTTEHISTLKIHKLTQEQYNQRLEEGKIEEDALYLTPDETIDLGKYATIENLAGKSDIGHTHKISDITNLQTSLNEKVPASRTINGKALNSNITLSATDVGADIGGSAATALSNSKIYTDNAVAQKSQVQIITWGDND